MTSTEQSAKRYIFLKNNSKQTSHPIRKQNGGQGISLHLIELRTARRKKNITSIFIPTVAVFMYFDPFAPRKRKQTSFCLIKLHKSNTQGLACANILPINDLFRIIDQIHRLLHIISKVLISSLPQDLKKKTDFGVGAQWCSGQRVGLQI